VHYIKKFRTCLAYTSICLLYTLFKGKSDVDELPSANFNPTRAHTACSEPDASATKSVGCSSNTMIRAVQLL